MAENNYSPALAGAKGESVNPKKKTAPNGRLKIYPHSSYHDIPVATRHPQHPAPDTGRF